MKTILVGDRDNDNFKLMSPLVYIKRTRCDRCDKRCEARCEPELFEGTSIAWSFVFNFTSSTLFFGLIVITERAKAETDEGGNDERFCLIFNLEIFGKYPHNIKV